MGLLSEIPEALVLFVGAISTLGALLVVAVSCSFVLINVAFFKLLPMVVLLLGTCLCMDPQGALAALEIGDGECTQPTPNRHVIMIMGVAAPPEGNQIARTATSCFVASSVFPVALLWRLGICIRPMLAPARTLASETLLLAAHHSCFAFVAHRRVCASHGFGWRHQPHRRPAHALLNRLDRRVAHALPDHPVELHARVRGDELHVVADVRRDALKHVLGTHPRLLVVRDRPLRDACVRPGHQQQGWQALRVHGRLLSCRTRIPRAIKWHTQSEKERERGNKVMGSASWVGAHCSLLTSRWRSLVVFWVARRARF